MLYTVNLRISNKAHCSVWRLTRDFEKRFIELQTLTGLWIDIDLKDTDLFVYVVQSGMTFLRIEENLVFRAV